MERLAARYEVEVEDHRLDDCLPTLHRHAFTEVSLVLGGRGWHRDGRGSAPIATGDVVVVAGDGAHGLAQVRQLRVRVIHADPSLLPWPDGVHLLRLGGEAWRTVRTLGDRLALEYDARRRGRDRALRAFVLELGVTLERLRTTMPTIAPDPIVAKIEQMLEQSMNRLVTIAELSQAAGLPRSTLLRRFAAAHGCGPLAWQQGLRLAEAKRLLASGDRSIAAIAASCGWNDANLFARRFRERVGISPSTFRRQAIRTGSPRTALA
jgi:AraC-like DNA-binding protein